MIPLPLFLASNMVFNSFVVLAMNGYLCPVQQLYLLIDVINTYSWVSVHKFSIILL